MDKGELLIILLLFTGLCTFATALVLVSIYLPANAAVYATLAAILGNFSGAFFVYVQQRAKRD